MKRIYFLLFAIFLQSTYCFANKIDSLENLLKSDKNNPNLLNQLSELYFDDSSLHSFQLAEKALAISSETGNNKEAAKAKINLSQYHYYQNNFEKSIGYSKSAFIYYMENNDTIGLAYASNLLGVSYYQLGDIDKTIKYFKVGAYLEQIADNSKGLATAYNNIGVLYEGQDKNQEALNYYLKSKEIKDRISDTAGLVFTYNNIAAIYEKLGDDEDALEYYLTAKEIAKNASMEKMHSTILNNIGSLYKKWGNFELAKKYFQSSFKLKRKIEDKKGLGTVINNLGSVYLLQNSIDSALWNFYMALSVFEEISFQVGISSASQNIGCVLLKKGEHKESIAFFDNALQIDLKLNQITGIVHAYTNLGKAYSNLGIYSKAEQNFLQAMHHAQNKKLSMELQSIYKCFSDLNYRMGRNSEAFTYFQLYDSIRASNFNEEKHKQIAELQTQYETKEKEKEIEILNIGKQLDKERISSQRKRILIIGVGLGVFVLATIISSILYLQKRKAYLMIVKQNVEIVKQEAKLERKIELREEYLASAKYQSSALEANTKQQLLDSIVVLMEEDKLFKNPQFTIEDLASKLETNRRYISQVINELLNSNFNNFINEYRVKEARKMLLNPSYTKLTLQAIAEDVGFHSRATFYTSFKKFTGVTPAFFQKNKQVKI